MRRGRGLMVIAVCALLVTCGFAAVARADSGGPGSPMAICQDLQDGKLDGSYTPAQWAAFMQDPTVQGYCSVIVPPCAYPGNTGTGGGSGSSGCSAATSARKTVALTPAPVTEVKGAEHTLSSTPLATTRPAGTLPFTGVQLSVVLAIGLALIAAGLALRVSGRPQRER